MTWEVSELKRCVKPILSVVLITIKQKNTIVSQDTNYYVAFVWFNNLVLFPGVLHADSLLVRIGLVTVGFYLSALDTSTRDWVFGIFTHRTIREMSWLKKESADLQNPVFWRDVAVEAICSFMLIFFLVSNQLVYSDSFQVRIPERLSIYHLFIHI